MPPIVIMICILLAYAILGMFMDAIGMLILTLPVVFPAVESRWATIRSGSGSSSSRWRRSA